MVTQTSGICNVGNVCFPQQTHPAWQLDDPHQSLFNLLITSLNLIPILITVNVLLFIGSFLCFGGGGAVFIVVPAELKGKLCSGSAKELLKDAPHWSAHHSARPGHQQDQLDARGRQG